MKMKGKVFLAVIAMMIFLLASTYIVKEVKAEELYTIAEGYLGFIEKPEVQVYYAVRMPSECKIGDVVPLILELRFDMSEEIIIPYVHLYGVVQGEDFDKEYFDVSRKTLEKGTRLTETFEVKLDGDTLDILFKYDIVVSEEEKQRIAGYHALLVVAPITDKLANKINDLENEIKNLKTTNTELSSQLNDLQKRYESLESKYQLISELGDLGTTRSFMYIFIITTIAFIATTVYFERRKPKVKILKTEEKRENALQILKVRYASGEITKEEYIEMKKTLES